MQVREARTEDMSGIRDVASRSLASTYSHFLDEDVIDHAVEEWFSDKSLESEFQSRGMLFLVALEGGDVVGFTQSDMLPDVPEGNILWLHVDPDYRGGGVGTALLGRTQEVLTEKGVKTLSGLVLADNEVGNEFYREHGFEKVSERTATIGDQTYTENVYTETDKTVLEPREVEGQTLYINRAESSRGSKAPFFVVFTDEAAKNRYGYFCSNCESFDNSMDSMERIECNKCGNKRKATRWDAAYL
ncbi:GNAT family N-acetyltransferase [Haladaptatus halobius]|uniref:GNAT family N-acetyltransferase n=1 Tax=Haladaptatus halobius TaxID=2884875 RepID=UPI001D0AB7A4|nr:GNAT family N-acetyltransferase [Haladaptatus halobius]